MKQSGSVVYKNNKISIKKLPEKNQDLQVFVRPNDSIEFPIDIKDATYQIVGGDVLLKLPDGGTITFVAMGLIAFTDNSVSINFPSARASLKDILSQMDDVKEAPVEAVVTDEFVKLDEKFADQKEVETAEENDNFSKILQEPTPAKDEELYKNKDENIAKPTEEIEQNSYNAVYKPTDNNPANINISEVDNAVEAGLKFTLTAYQTASSETTNSSGVITEVDGGGGSAYGAQVDTPEAQFQPETLDYSKNTDGSNNTNELVIHSDSPSLFKTNSTDLTSESQLARDLSIKPEQPTGFGISAISISNLPDGYKIVGATYNNGVWEVPEATYDANGNILTNGFSVNVNTGKARFTMTYPDDQLEGAEVTAVINFTSSFSTDNLLPGESVETPDVLSLSGQGRLNFVTKEIDWEDPTGYEAFSDDEGRVVLATNPNNNIVFTSHGNSTVYGGDGKDTVTAYEGDDTLNGADGDDILDGGAGNDSIYGDDGDDTLIGQGGTNTLDGGDATDTVDYSFVTDAGGVTVDLSANSGSSLGVVDTILNVERVVGSSKDDEITGDYLANILEGSDGDDSLIGLAGNDTLLGGSGDDELSGSLDNDTLYGGTGDDTLDGGTGDDKIYGEAGNDTFFHDAGDDTLDGGLGTDTMDFTGFASGVEAYIYQGDVTIANNDGNDVISNMEILSGSADNDQLTGGSDNNTLYGQDGDDTLKGNEGNDLLEGGDGADTLKGGADIDILLGGDGTDFLFGEAGADKLDGGSNTSISTDNPLIDSGDNSINIAKADNHIIEVNTDGEIVATDGSIFTIDTNDNILDSTGEQYTLNTDYDLTKVSDGTVVGLDNKVFFVDATNQIVDQNGLVYSGKFDGDTADYSDEGAIRTTLNGSTYTGVSVSGGDSDQIKNIENIQGSNTGNDSIKGDGLINVLDGQGGDDTIDGAGGDDTVLGGAGNDTLSGGAGLDLIDGGSHDTGFGDTVDYTLEGRIVVDLQNSGDTTVEVDGVVEDTLRDIENITGSKDYNDTITGNDQKNILFGLGGVDTLSGEEGDDTLYGGDDTDTLYGGEGKDDIFGGAGNDTLDGGAGSDNLDGGTGTDFVSYASATTNMNIRLDLGTATGEGAVDGIVNVENIQGSANKDTIVGNDSINILQGGDEQDTISGGLGNDILYGEAGDDTLSGDQGDDLLVGGDDLGNDYGVDTSTTGNDTADYSSVTNNTSLGIKADLTQAIQVTQDGYDGKDTFIGIENVTGSNYVDTIIGDANENSLSGGAGKDSLYGGDGDDILDGGSQDDTLRGDLGDDELLGGDGLDTADYSNVTNAIIADLRIVGANVTDDGYGDEDTLVDVENIIGSDLDFEADGTTPISDIIIGNDTNNALYGLKGDDTLKGGSGLDTLDGGDGNDTLFGGADADTLTGGLGDHDIVDYSDVTANGVNVNLSTGIATGDGDDKLFTIEDIRGSGLGDILAGNSGVNTIYGGAGNDTIEGGEKIQNSTDTDLLYGEAGDDTLRGDAGNDILVGGDADGNDNGSDTADYSNVIDVGLPEADKGVDVDLSRVEVSGDDTTYKTQKDGYGTKDSLEGIENVSGTEYNDILKGSNTLTELNTLSGNDGDDSFLTSDGADSIIGGADKDTIDYNAITNGTSTGIVMDFDSIVDEKSIVKTTATGTYTDKVQGIEKIIATEYTDNIKGDSGENEYLGMSGDDTISGNSGDDILYGDDLENTLTGDDTLDGGIGDDILHGGKGDDILIGGAGDDIIDGGDDFDIVDYTSSQAKISLDENDVIGADTGTDTLSNIELIYATLYADTLVGSSSKDDVIDGRGGADTIIGKNGADTLYGYTGSDTIKGGLGSDVLIGGSDADIDTVGFDGGISEDDLNSVVNVDLESDTHATVVSLNQATTIVVDTVYSFDVNILDDSGGIDSTTTATYTATLTDTGDSIIEALLTQVDSITGITTLHDTNNSPSDDVDFNSHRILFMDTATVDGFSITGIDTSLLLQEQAGTSSSVNTVTGNTETDFLFDFDNIIGTDITLASDGVTRVGDTLEGNSANNIINAGDGDDTVFSTSGTDIIDGESGSDWIDYSKQTTRVNVDLDNESGTLPEVLGSDNFGNTLKDIENVRGTDATVGDTIIGDDDDNILEGGTNNNSADENANYESLYGGGGDDIIYGDYIDTTLASGGRDIIYGNAGDDTLYGGAASDRFYGGTGSDTYIGGSGTDYVHYNGDDGTNDAISINLTTNVVDAHGDIANGIDLYQEIEYIYGSDGGADTFIGDINDATRNISFNGLNGNDKITGGLGNDNLIGEDGADTLDGGDGADVLTGGNGADTLTGGDGNDILSGNDDNDTFFASRGVDTISGGNQTDIIDFRDEADNAASTGTDVENGIEVDFRATFDIGGTDYGVINNNGFSGEDSYILGVENLNATNYDDIFTGNASKNIVNLYDGDDRVFLSSGGDTIDGGDNNLLSAGGGDWVDATYSSTGGSIYLSSGFESMGSPYGSVTNFEHIKGSTLSDYRLQGDDQNNTILGEGGDDTLVGLEGDDYLDGGDHDLNGGDTVSYSETSAASTSSIVVHFDTVTKTVSDGFTPTGTDTLVNIETVIGSTHNDVFYGSTTQDTFLSGGGQDLFYASLGDDFLSGNEGGVSASLVDYSAITSGKLILDLTATSSDQAKVVDVADDTTKVFTDELQSIKNIKATNADDTLTGDSADNSLYGLGGDDTFFASDGNDTYDGGTTGTNKDLVDYSQAVTTEKIIINLDAGTAKGIGGSTDGLTSIEDATSGKNSDTITGSSSVNTLIANEGSDTVFASEGADELYGDIVTKDASGAITGHTNSSNDDLIDYSLSIFGNTSGVTVNLQTSSATAFGSTDAIYDFEHIKGSENIDNLTGSDAIVNIIDAGSGADTIYATSGADTLLGAGGNDTFVYTDALFGDDAIVDGGDDSDTLEITDAATLTDVQFTNISNTEAIKLGNASQILTLASEADEAGITNIDASGVSTNTNKVVLDATAMSNDLTITGGSGDDTLRSGSGTDIVNAGDGNDILNGGDGSDTLRGGANNDLFEYSDANDVDSDILEGGTGANTLQTTSDQDYDFQAATMSDIQTLVFSDDATDQNITIDATQASMFTTITSNDTDEDVLIVNTNNTYVDLSAKTFTNIENTQVTQTASSTVQAVELTGNDTTKDTLTGGSKNDILSGLAGNDRLVGNTGDDTFLDGSGDDVILGGSGEDTIKFSAANLTSADNVDGGETTTTDTLEIIDKVTTVNILDADFTNVNNVKILELSADETHDLVLSTKFSDSVINVINANTAGSNAVSVNIDAVSSDVAITTGAGNDTITLGSGANTANTGYGNDTINVKNDNLDANDIVNGNDGQDTLFISDTADIVSSDISNVNAEELLTAGNNDLIDITLGNAYINTITTGDGDDTVKIKEGQLGATTKLDGGDHTVGGGDTLNIAGDVNLSAIEVINFENIVGDDDLSLTVAQATGKTITVSTDATTGNTVSIVGNPTASDTNLDASNITAKTLAFTAGLNSATTATGLNIDVDASDVAIALDLTFNDVAGLDVISGDSMTIDATALGDDAIQKTLTITGDGAVEVTIDNDTTLDASTNSAKVVVNDGTGINAITTGDGADTITSLSGADIISTGGGNDVVNLSTNAATVDGGTDTDRVNLNAATTYSSAFSNIDSIVASENVTLSGSVDSDLDFINIASGKTISTTGTLIAGNDFDFEGAGNVNITGIDAGNLDSIGFKNTGTLKLSTDGGEIDITNIDTATTSLSSQSNISLIGASSTDTFSIDAKLDNSSTTIDGNDDVDTLNINETVDFSDVTIKEIEIYNLNASNDLSGKIPAGVNEINIASGKRVTITGQDIDAETLSIDLADASTKVEINDATGSNFAGLTLNKAGNTADAGIAIFTAKSAGGILNISNIDISNFANGDVSVVGGAGADVITGTTLADTITSGAGADTISSGLGADVINTGDNDDIIKYASQAELAGDSLVGGTGNDTLELTATGSYDLNALNATTLSDIQTLQLNNASDVTLNATQLSNLSALLGSTGTDKVILNNSTSASVDLSAKSLTNIEQIALADDGYTLTLSEVQIEIAGQNIATITGGAGADTLAFSTGDIDLRATTISAIETIKFVNTTSDQEITLNDTQLAGITNFDGSQATGVKELTIEAGNTQGLDLSSAGLFSNVDQLNLNIASGASHTFTTTAFKDVVTIGGTNGNSIISGAGEDTIYGSSNNDWISSGADNDSIVAGTGADTIYAGDGDDIIEISVASMVSSDTLDGGNGSNDILQIEGNAGTITSADLSNVTSIETLKSANANLDITLNDLNNFETVDASAMLSGGGELTVDTRDEASSVSVIGGANDDTITIGLNDNVSANDGDDTINLNVAGTYTGTLSGGGNTDTLNINAGVDISGATINTIEVINIVDGAGTIDLTGKLASVTNLNVDAGEVATLTATDLTNKTITLNDGEGTDTGTIKVAGNLATNALDALTLTKGTLEITADAGTVDITGLTNTAGTINLKGTDAGNETFVVDQAVNSVNGGTAGSDVLSINTTTAPTTITKIETININETLTLSTALDSELANIVIANGKTLTTSAANVDGINVTDSGTDTANIMVTDLEADTNLSSVVLSGTTKATVTSSLILATANLNGFDIEITDTNSLTATDTQVDGLTITDSGASSALSVNIAANSSADFSRFNLDGATSSLVTLNFSNATTFSGTLGSGIDVINIANGASLTMSALELDGESLTFNTGTGGALFITGATSALDLDGITFTGDSPITITGTTAADILDLELGASSTYTGSITVNAGSNNDTIINNDLANTLNGETGNDTFTLASVTGSTIDGGTQTTVDTANYSTSSTALTFTLDGSPSVSDGSKTDTLTSIEKFVGSSVNDIFNITASFSDTIDGSGGANNVINITGTDIDISLATISSIQIINVGSGQSVIISEAQADSLVVTGAGTVKFDVVDGTTIDIANITTDDIVVTATNAGTIALSNVTSNVNASTFDATQILNISTADGSLSFTGGSSANDTVTYTTSTELLPSKLTNIEHIITNAVLTISEAVENALGTTDITGAGSVKINMTGGGTIDADNLDVDIALIGGGTGTTSVTNLSTSLDASDLTSGENLSVTLEDTSLTITTGSGTNTINADALNDESVVTVLGSDDVTINLTNGDVDASGMTATPIVTVNGGAGSNVIDTADGADIINLSSSNDTVNTNSGSDTINIDGDNLTSDDIIDAGAGDNDVLNITANATLSDADFTNISNFNTLNLTASGDSVTLDTEANNAFEAGSTVNGLAGNDDFTIDFSNIGKFTIDGGNNEDSITTLNGSIDISGATNASLELNASNIENLDISSITLSGGDGDGTSGKALEISDTDIANWTTGAAGGELDLTITSAQAENIELNDNGAVTTLGNTTAGTYTYNFTDTTVLNYTIA